MSVWSQLREQEAKKPSVWDAVKQEPKTPPVRAKRHEGPVRADNILPPSTVSFDIETDSVDNMWRSDSSFLRLIGYAIDDNEVQVTQSPGELLRRFEENDGWIIGHNIMNFDLIILEKYCGLNILKLAKKGRFYDTKLLAFLADPPVSRTKEGQIEKTYSLENQGQLYLGTGKLGDLKAIAKKYGGYDQIPCDDPEYVEYLKRDVEVTRGLCGVIPINDYAIREHKIAAIASTISLSGFRVDVELLEARIKEGEEKRVTILDSLVSYGLPGQETTKAPHRTKLGIAAIDTAFRDLGVDLPRTEKTGRPALGKEILHGVIDETDSEEVTDLAEAILGLNGIRSCYQNVHENLVGDRVHPSINLRQSTGRWSTQKPGLTTIGKRAGKVIERAVFLPEEGEVLISCDLAQVDARAVAGLSQDLEYLKLFEPGRDLHSEMAVRLFGDITKREQAKNGVHAINYGARAKKIAWMTGMSEYDASGFVQEFERNFPVLCDWQRNVRIEGETTGILYNGYGRMMRIEPERSFTQSPALEGQSTARDILMQGILNLWEIGGEDIVRRIRGCIHDEIILTCPVKDAEEIENLVVKAMSFEWCPEGGKYPVQIMAGLNKRGINWADCYRKD